MKIITVFVDRPKFLPGQESYVYTWAGQRSVIECSFQAEPAATVGWFVKGIQLENNNTFHIANYDSNSSLQVGELFYFLSVCRKFMPIIEVGSHF